MVLFYSWDYAWQYPDYGIYRFLISGRRVSYSWETLTGRMRCMVSTTKYLATILLVLSSLVYIYTLWSSTLLWYIQEFSNNHLGCYGMANKHLCRCVGGVSGPGILWDSWWYLPNVVTCIRMKLMSLLWYILYSRKFLCGPIINMNVQCRYMYYNGDDCVSPYSQNCLSMKDVSLRNFLLATCVYGTLEIVLSGIKFWQLLGPK